jgi:hypothetical protein
MIESDGFAQDRIFPERGPCGGAVILKLRERIGSRSAGDSRFGPAIGFFAGLEPMATVRGCSSGRGCIGTRTQAPRSETKRQGTRWGRVWGTNRRHNRRPAAFANKNPAGTEVPAGFCSRRCSLQTGGNGLFQRSIDVGEDALNRRAEAVDDRNDRERDTCRDQTVFNGGRRLLIHPKLLKKIPQSMPPC